MSAQRYRLFQVGFVVLLTIFLSCNRSSGPRRLTDFRVEFGDHNIPAQMTANGTVTAQVVVKNISQNVWPSKPNPKGLNAVNLSYHWLGRKGDIVVSDGLRTPLPNDVAPGESVSLNASIRAPQRAGKYTLDVTLVQEGVAWFPEREGDKLSVAVFVADEQPDAATSSTKELRDAVKSTKKSKRSQPLDGSGMRSSKNSLAVPTAGGKAQPPQSIGTDRPKEFGDQNARRWTVQVRSFPERESAQSLAKTLRGKKHDAYVMTAVVNGREWHRVCIGRLESRAEAEKLQQALKADDGLTQTLVITAPNRGAEQQPG